MTQVCIMFPIIISCCFQLLEAQANYHRQALEVIEAVIPKMRETLSCNPTKPVYGVPLEEHLRVANRDIAAVLESCICYLLEFGLEEEVRLIIVFSVLLFSN